MIVSWRVVADHALGGLRSGPWRSSERKPPVVPLVIHQEQSPRVESWIAEDPEMALWILTPVEVTSALWRLVREGALTEPDARTAEEGAQLLAGASHTVTDIEGVKRTAERLLRVHALRAADTLQLAAAIRWSAGAAAAATLHTLDERLATAARREGFNVP
ncbi:MAG TPA: type II toxin-antitoxin system VapC family toxin [Gemmatimonadaceae bacterium]